MSEPRVIKKYPNRRLYDTVESRYITLADVRRLVLERIDFVVADKKNNADITRSILLQVISEQEHLADPVLTRDFLVNVIRSYGGNLQSMVSGHLDQSLKQFMSQAQGRERLKSTTGDPPRLRPAGSAADDSFKRQRESDKDRDDSNLTK
jgi:polyhydroxyalkanoate synthesis repressor PhaR